MKRVTPLRLTGQEKRELDAKGEKTRGEKKKDGKMSVRERLLRYGVRGKSERMRVERAKMYKRERGGTASFLLLTYLL